MKTQLITYAAFVAKTFRVTETVIMQNVTKTMTYSNEDRINKYNRTIPHIVDVTWHSFFGITTKTEEASFGGYVELSNGLLTSFDDNSE